MTKQAARPLAEVQAALAACAFEHAKWPTRDTMHTLRRAEKALIDASNTPGDLRDALAILRRSQAEKATKTRAALIGGAYMKLANLVEAAIAAEQAEAAARVALAAECEARIEAARAAAPATTKLASGMEVETRLILSITGKPGDQWAMVQGLKGQHPIHDADAAPVRAMFFAQMDAVMDCRTPAQQAEIDAQIEAAEDAEAERADMQAKAARLAELTAPTPTPPAPAATWVFQATATNVEPEYIRDMDLSDVLEANPIFLTLARAQGYHEADHRHDLNEMEPESTETLDWAQVAPHVWEATSDAIGMIYRVTECQIH